MITMEILEVMVSDWHIDYPNDNMTIQKLMNIMGITESDIVDEATLKANLDRLED